MRNFHRQFDSFQDALDNLPDDLTSQPFLTIPEHYENVYKFAGKRVFRFGCLQAISPYAPKLKYSGEEERISLNVLLLGNPSSGKTQMLDKIKKMAPLDKYNWVQKETAHEIQEKVTNFPEGLEIIVNDLKTVMGDQELLKTYEAIIEEGMVKRDTANETIDSEDVRAAMMAAAVPSDIEQQIYGGLIFRIIPIRVKYDKEQQKKIGKNIADKLSSADEGEEQQEVDDEKDLVFDGVYTDTISDFYDVLYWAMNGNYKDFPQIQGYHIPTEATSIVNRGFNNAIDELQNITSDANLTRQLWDGYRMMVLHALLNMHKRDLITWEDEEKGEQLAKIKIEETDAKVAKALMQLAMDTIAGFIDQPKVRQQLEKINDYEDSGQFSADILESYL